VSNFNNYKLFEFNISF